MAHEIHFFYKSCSSSKEWFCRKSSLFIRSYWSTFKKGSIIWIWLCRFGYTDLYKFLLRIFWRRLFYGLNWCRTSSFFTAENSRRYVYECIKAFEKRCVSVSRKFKQFFLSFLSIFFIFFSLVRMHFIRNIHMNSIIFRKSILMFYIYFRSKLTYFFFLFKDNVFQYFWWRVMLTQVENTRETYAFELWLILV